jgi:uridine kinase
VIVLAGPSGAGKSRLAERLGRPVLRLDDFYRDHDDADLPRIADGPLAGLVDWDHPRSWSADDAVTALVRLCHDGSGDVPVYSLSDSARTGTQHLDLAGSPLVVAEGIFAPEVVAGVREAGLLAAAYCIRQHAAVTFWRRLTRDLREHRKPPLVLVRRGLALLRDQRRVVDHAVTLGCTPATPEEAYAALAALA